jgi:hypothetical protein
MKRSPCWALRGYFRRDYVQEHAEFELPGQPNGPRPEPELEPPPGRTSGHRERVQGRDLAPAAPHAKRWPAGRQGLGADAHRARGRSFRRQGKGPRRALRDPAMDNVRPNPLAASRDRQSSRKLKLDPARSQGQGALDLGPTQGRPAP